jgi:uncharacterized membrane protein YdjX (TVP38/TMEM64 family)
VSEPGGSSADQVTALSAGIVSLARSPWPKTAFFIVLLGTMAVLAATGGGTAIAVTKEWVAGLGWLGPLAFLVCYALAVLAFLPMSVLAAAAGVLFGPFVGIPLAWLGTMAGALGAFGLGRGLSRQAVEELAGSRLGRVNALLHRRGTTAVLLLRLLPAGPFALLNYVVAVTGLGVRQFLVGTGIGIIPGVAVYTTLGSAAEAPDSPAFVLAASALVVITVAGALGIRRISTSSR